MDNFFQYKERFDTLMGVKNEPNEKEKALFVRAEKYIRKISWIPGLRMVAVVNSLSMYATHEDSDIDLFIVTSRGTMWSVRVMVTLILWMHGVWRHGEDIAGNFCLSFFITEDAMDISTIAIEDDIYLYYWLYYMKPILIVGDVWERFDMMNPGLKIKFENSPLEGCRRKEAGWFARIQDLRSMEVPIKKNKPNPGEIFAKICDTFIHPLGEWKARRSWEKKGRPEGVIISRDILKFHDRDRRCEIRDALI